MKKYILLVLVMLLFVLGCGSKSAQNEDRQSTDTRIPSDERKVNQNPDDGNDLSDLGFLTPTQTVSAPDFTLDNLEARSVSLSSLKGKMVFINFWGTWCQYCLVEMPSIQRMYEQLKNKDFEILAISVNDTPEAAKSYVRDNKLSFPILLDLEYRATQLYGVRGFPTTYIVDKSGNLIGKLVGSREWDTPDVIEVFKAIIDNDS
jgi:peroxiredoxin